MDVVEEVDVVRRCLDQAGVGGERDKLAQRSEAIVVMD